MSIFGKIDAANVKTNPGHVEPGIYSAQVTDARINVSENGNRQLIIVYTIDNEDSMYLDKKVTKFYFLPDPDLDEEKLLLLPADEQKKIMRNVSNLKRDLCGNAVNSQQRGLGVDPDELNGDDWDPKSLIGSKVNISITNYGPTNEGVNIKWVNLAD